MITSRRSLALYAAAALFVPMACGSDDAGSADTGSANTGSDGTEGSDDAAIDVIASFYPLQFVVERVGGERVDVSNLTPAGAEPHDLELTGDDAASLQDAQLVVYLGGFSPALDDAIVNVSSDNAFDVAEAARLDVAASADDGHGHEGEHEEEHEAGHEDETEEEHAEHDDGSGAGSDAETDAIDPHFWLDPTRVADVADAVAARMTELDPDGAATFEQNAATLRTELEALDADFEAGLAECTSRDLVTSHAAFGYLAARYDLTQIGVSGLLPESEPSPADLAEVTEYVREHDVSTIYSETLIDPAVAETVAAESGASTAVLDPLEGLNDDSQGSDYFEVMRSNLSNLRTGQGCS